MANNTIKVLLVDDAEEVYDLFVAYLENSDHDCEFVVEYIPEFNERIIDFDFDVYVIDDMFKGVSKSIEIVKKIRVNDSDSKVFVLSGQANPKTLQDLINLRVDGFIDKDDFNVEPIITACESIIMLREQFDRLSSKMSKLLSIKK